MSPDPFAGRVNLRNPQSWNRYSYAGNDPVNANDASGLWGSGRGGAPPTTGPAWGMNPFGNPPSAVSPCQAYLQAYYAAHGYDGNTLNGDWAGFTAALATCNGYFAFYSGTSATGDNGGMNSVATNDKTCSASRDARARSYINANIGYAQIASQLNNSRQYFRIVRKRVRLGRGLSHHGRHE